MDNRQMLIAAVIGGLVITVLTSVPVLNLINCLLCAGVWIGGIVAVWFYKRQTATLPTGSQGAIIGAVAGGIGAILASIASLIVGGAMMESMIAADTTGTLQDSLGSFVGTGMNVAIVFLFNIVLYPIFGAIGGAAYAALTGSRTPKAGV